ncbi:MAG: hypothetical protein AAGD05_07410 [Bacteroidota bacterium]
MRKVSSIPFHRNIVELYQFLGLTTSVEKDFHIESHQDLQAVLPKSTTPFRNDFYEVSLITKGSSLSFTINQQEFQTPEQYLVFTCPQQVRSWQGIEPDLEGYVAFFNLHYLNHRDDQDWLAQFPFFNIFNWVVHPCCHIA